MRKSRHAEKVVIEYADWTAIFPWLTQIAFVLSIALVIARMLMIESFHEPLASLDAATAPPRTCGPAGSVILDLLCCMPALLVLARRVLDKKYILRLSVAQISLALFAALALASTAWASNKAQALVMSFHVIAAASLFWSTAQLVRSWSRLRIITGICLGLVMVYVLQGLVYRYSDVPETIDYWEHHRSEEMRAHGWQEGDFALQQYEQKLKNAEMVGFQASPNTLAAVMVLMCVVVAGVAVQRIAWREDSGMIGATVLAIPFACWIIWLTHSNAAFVTPFIAALTLVAVGKWGAALSRKRQLVFAACLFAVLLATAALLGHGIYHQSLPTSSLNFRWRYWVASAHLFRAHPMLGVGYGNFGDAYLHYRLAAASEEIKDPHNLIVRAATELGIPGAILMIAWLIAAWWDWTRPVFPPAPAAQKQSHGTRRMIITVASIAILGILIKIIAGIDFTADSSWVTFELLRHLVYGTLLLIGMAIVVVRSTKETSIDDRPAAWVMYGMIVGLAVFLIHNTIDFSLFETGPMLLFMLLGGAVAGARRPSAAGAPKRTPAAIGAFFAVLLAWMAGWIVVAIPLAQAESRADDGDDEYRKHNYAQAAQDYQAAFMSAPAKDPDYAMRAARALMYLPDRDGGVRTNLGLAIAANPNDPLPHLTRAGYDLARHPDERTEIRYDYDRALELNPHDIDTRLEYAKVLDQLGDHAAALDQYRVALKTNEGFDPTEPKRLSKARVDEINQKLKQ